jgi:hypothetical protein
MKIELEANGSGRLWSVDPGAWERLCTPEGCPMCGEDPHREWSWPRAKRAESQPGAKQCFRAMPECCPSATSSNPSTSKRTSRLPSSSMPWRPPGASQALRFGEDEL